MSLNIVQIRKSSRILNVEVFCSSRSNRDIHLIRMSVKSLPNQILENTTLYAQKNGQKLIDDPATYRDGEIIPTTDELLADLKNEKLHIYPDDIWLASYPKTGTTWMTKIIQNILFDADDTRCKAHMDELISAACVRIELGEPGPARIQELNALTRPRLLITHLQERFIPRNVFNNKSKIIITYRNPKDTAVSYYHMHRMCAMFGRYTGTSSEFLSAYIRGETYWGSWGKWYEDWWTRHKSNENVMFISYEDMKKKPKDAVLRVGRFLGKQLTDEVADKILEKCSFTNMKENTEWVKNFDDFDHSISPFFRKGQVGDWMNHFLVAENDDFDKEYEKYDTLLREMNIQYE